MKHNHYDNERFFNQYANMARSQFGLDAAGEWPQVLELLPEFKGLNILDLGCGYGWHCKYFIEQGAKHVYGLDLSSKMIQEARVKNNHANIEYHVGAIEELQVDYQFDFIFSSLTLHYVENYRDLVKRVYSMLKSKGSFLFVVEHPIFTAQGQQEWIMGDDGVPLHWPVDRYYDESWRESNFLDTKIEKFHRSMSSYVNPLIEEGFTLEALTEVIPPADWVSLDPRNADELRRPMMLIIKATKK